jgi:diaminopimelate decarboxylase
MKLFALDASEAIETARRYGTPSFVYRLDAAEARYRRLRAALPDRCRLAYAVKANAGSPLLALFASLGSWFDCASDGELAKALAALEADSTRTTESGTASTTSRTEGRDRVDHGSRILFAGPGKNDDDVKAALAAGARLQIDGVEDLERIKTFRDPAGAPLDVNLRIHPAGGISEGSRIIGGTGPSAFGVDEEDLESFLDQAKAYPQVRIAGLQVFAASNEKDHQVLLQNHRSTLAIGRRMHEAYGLELDLIDLGGGLGIPYSVDECELDVEALGAGLAGLLEEHTWFKGNLVLEPGRWLAGPCGVYLSRVTRTKASRGTQFAIMEGGINHLLRPLLTGQPFPVMAPGIAAQPVAQTLAGPLCTSLDRLGEVRLPLLARGDLVMFGQTGAYGYTEAMNDFLCRPRPDEVWLP